jgi:DNA-binding response OmpR family regulator
MTCILIIEDDTAINRGLRESLSQAGYEVSSAMDGETGVAMAMQESPDLVILDILLPRLNGYEVCQRLRDQSFTVPILMLTSKKEEEDKLHGFTLGADDYLTKPFSVSEVLARVKAILRRSTITPSATHEHRFGDCTVDFSTQMLTRNGEQHRLSSKELGILRYFLLYEGVVITRETLLNEVWGYEVYPTTRTVDNYILSLRKKVEADPAEPRHILTVPTQGYRFVRE